MNLNYVKGFLRVDTDCDDEYILLLMSAAREYIKDAIGSYEEEKARVRLLALNIIATLYENRQYTINKLNDKVAYSLRSMVLQLQLSENSRDD